MDEQMKITSSDQSKKFHKEYKINTRENTGPGIKCHIEEWVSPIGRLHPPYALYRDQVKEYIYGTNVSYNEHQKLRAGK